MKKRLFSACLDGILIVLGSVIFALSFDLFLEPNGINAGGLTGLGMVLIKLLGFGRIGVLVLCINIPLFLAGWHRLGRRFFLGSLLGMVVSNLAIDLLAPVLPAVCVEPLMACLYGGALTGLGLGLVFVRGASTGGTDILARLLQNRMRSFSMGRVMLALDLVVVLLTGVVFCDLNKTLYSAVVLFVCSKVLDAVVYGLDYSKVAIIISDQHQEIVTVIEQKLDRGATLLQGQGAYTGQAKQVILVALKPRQLAELKEAVAQIDRNAFVIVQDAHQVQGEGFSRYAKNGM